MTPADYPMVRIVPSKIAQGGTVASRSDECLIYFGSPVHEFDAGLESLYADLLALEAALIDAATGTAGIVFEYAETIADEDRVDGYKLMAIRATVEA